MRTRHDLSVIQGALAELDRSSRAEYGRGLEELLADPSPDSALRLQRLTGIALKRPFAVKSSPPAHSVTGARNSWPWAPVSPDTLATSAPEEFAILDELRKPGPWHERTPPAGNADDDGRITWDQLKDDADNERGLFKILALYVDDKLKKRDTRTLREYLDADESRRFETGLDLAQVVFDWGVTPTLLTLLGVPPVAVGLALVGVQYGFKRATDTNTERVGDRSS